MTEGPDHEASSGPSSGAGREAGGRAPARRPLVVLAVLAVVVAVIALSRAGLPDPPAAAPTPSPTPAGTPLLGTVISYAAGQARLYVLAETCTGTGCRLRLVTSGDDGRTWTEGTLPTGYPTDLAAARRWRLTVAGPDDRLSIETGDRVATSPDAGRTFLAQRIVDGPAVERVPSNQEAFARLCPATRCRTPAVEFLQPRSGVRSTLAHQPPFPPSAFGVEGAQLWAAGIDPRTKRWTVAASTDDGASWDAAVLPPFNDEPGLRPRLLPVPDDDQAFFVLTAPGDPRYESVYGVWTVPNPRTGAPPRLIRPESGGPGPGLESAVATTDGRLVLADGPFTVLAADGVVEQTEVTDPYRMPLYRSVGRGLRNQLAAIVDDDTGMQPAGLALSATGSPNDWRVVRIYLPDR